MTTPATPVDPIESIQQQLAAGEHRAAWAQMVGLIEHEATSAACHAVAGSATKLDAKAADLVPMKVALLANFTADSLAPVLTARALRSRLLVEPYLAGFDTWMQEILDPTSGLRAADPDVVVLALHVDALAPNLVTRFLELTPAEAAAEVEAAAERVEQAVAALRTWSHAKLLLHTVPAPATPALGILDARLPAGQTKMFARLNERLAALAEREADVYLVDVSRLMAAVGAARWHDARLWGMARIPFSAAAVHALAEEYIRHLRAFNGLARKVLVLDLDETLWGGILGEDGPEGIKLGDRYPGNAFVELQHAALGLHRRGVVLAVNSKNNTDEALEVLANHPAMVLRPEHFASTRINWQDKSANMIEIAEELGLGLDSFVFVDDSAVECERMRQALPDVLTVQLAGEPALWASTLLGLGVFDTLSYSEEDRQRGAFYRQEAQRAALRGTAQSIEDFYRSLEMRLTVEPVSRTTLPRAADLTQRTNQFNLTTKRYTEGEFAAALAEPGCEAWVFRLVDRFGDNGIIGLAMLEGTGPTVTISTLLMSCRVLRRTVEDAVLAVLVGRARERGATAIEGRYRPTRKNAQTSGFYAERGFAPAESDGDTQRFVRDLATPLEPPAWIEISRPDAGPA